MPSQLPEPLAEGPFRVLDGEYHGVTPKRLRGRDLDRSVWGVRGRIDEESIRSRCELLAVRMPADAFFSHTTAALLLGIPLPPMLAGQNAIHVSVPRPQRAPHASGLKGHSLTINNDAELVYDSMLVHTSAARTWCDLGSMLKLTDLVAAGDYLIHWEHPLTTAGELGSVARAMSRRRGSRNRAAALPLMNDRAESRPESILRVLIHLAGLPTPVINHELRLTEAGTRVRTDLAFPLFKIVLEYQGDYHRTLKGQWRKDMTRRSRLEADGWYVMELNADDLKNPEELIARIRGVLLKRGWRP